MAKAADADSVNEAEKFSNIDWQSAIDTILTTVHGLESEQRSLSADAKDAWERIEALGVNKVGAQLFSKMLKKPVEKRRDEFRTFYMLAKQAGWFDWLQDLVDRAQAAPAPSAAPKAPAAPGKPEPKPGPPGDLDLAGQRVNLKSGWVQKLKPGIPADAKDPGDNAWEDVRQATPSELANAREALQSDFDDAPAPAQPEPEVAKAKKAAREKAGK